ncbi:hypothetical protein DPMN_112762 [Dreissena polymorpha]|uniref:Uncharacterized protein n=1 Tax=Dreissena polymorpha TaxID=45954 RepID=A0A9D4KH05_DREPO|nr:hypothetical protein DPMN_112762 [Dreissena polymorpha]
MAENLDKSKAESKEKDKAKEAKEPKKNVPSRQEKDDSKILELLMEIKQTIDKSEQTLSDVCKRVVDLENSENCYDLQGYDEEYVDHEPDPCSRKRSHDESC